MRKKDRAILPLLFLFISLSVISLSVYGMTGNRYDTVEAVYTDLIDEGGSHRQACVSSYLSHSARAGALYDAFLILEDEKRRLSDIEKMIDQLEKGRETFLRNTAQKSELFEANVSLFGVDELLGDLRVAEYFKRYRSRFVGDQNRRVRVFFDEYNQQRLALQAQNQHHQKKIEELTDFISQVTQKEELYEPEVGGSWLLSETEQQLVQRALFYIRQEDYSRAAGVIGAIADKELDGGGVSYALCSILLKTIDELQQRIEYIRTQDPLSAIRMSYLAEDYEGLLSESSRLTDDELLKPLLNVLMDAVHRNILIEREISEEIGLKHNLSLLVARAREIEAQGEYTKASELYRKLLLFDLPPHDREHIIGRLYVCASKNALSNVKRSDNTGAIKLLDEARNLAWEGKRKEAIKMYRSLILRYPNSDYIEQALDELADLLI